MNHLLQTPRPAKWRLLCLCWQEAFLAAIVIIPLLFCRADAATTAISIYVSPTGNNAFSGRLSQANSQGTDGPVATIDHARDLVRSMRQKNGGLLSLPVNIVLRGGTYWLPRPLELSPQDSGVSQLPIAYIAYGNERPVISAGRPVRQWESTSFNGHQVWVAKLPKLGNADCDFHELWVNGHRRWMARLPKRGFFRAGDVPGLSDSTPLMTGQNSFHYDGEDLKDWPDSSDADVVVMSLWTESHLPVKAIEPKDHLIHFKQPSVIKMARDDRYFIEGAAEFLTEPGEWYFNRRASQLYYMPMDGETISNCEIVVPRHEQILRLEGAPEKGQFIEHINFRGITFSNSEWRLPKTGPTPSGETSSGFTQAAWGVPGAIWGQGVRDCKFENCTIAHVGNYAIELGEGCQRNKIRYCTLTDMGGGGIKLGETKVRTAEREQTKKNEISDCTIADCGNIFPSAVGLWLGQTSQNLISHNDIHGLWYSAISIGWTWGYGASAAHDNIIEFNHVHHVGTPANGIDPILSDMGGIYTLGKEPGTVIRNNVFHDIAALRYGGWGIYFDEGSSNILAENNLVYRTTHGGFHQHYGQDNVVHNNIFAFGRDAQIRRSRIEDHLSFTFERNLVYWDHGALLDGNWTKLNVAFDFNTYWHVGGEDFKFANMTFDQWRKAGMDAHGQIRQIPFADPVRDDFSLKAGAERNLAGFIPFSILQVGPRPREQSPR